MKLNRLVSGAIVLAFGLGLSAGAYAQARHDEKPHNPTMKSDMKKAKKAKQAQQPSAGGRHDDKPHVTPKAKAETEKK